MRKRNVIFASCGILLVVGYSYFLTQAPQPLAFEPRKMTGAEREFHAMQVKGYSQPAFGGKAQFEDHCAQCHGRFGDGTEQGPSLLNRDYSRDFRESDLFHGQVGRQIPAHQAFLGDQDETVTFNRIEMMGKFLREVQRKGPPEPVVE